MTINWTEILDATAHRPWPKPDRPWVMTMSWINLLAAHWPVEPEKLAADIPEGLTLDLWEGKAWLSVVPFEMANVAPRGLTWWPRQMHFPELNLRTYVTAEGEKPGVWFYNLEAASRLAVRGARTFFNLPYFNAHMTVDLDGERVAYKSRRTHRNAGPAEFIASYEPTGPPAPAIPGTFDHWVMERYCLYAAKRRGIFRCDVQHLPWPLRPGEVEIERNTLFEAIGLELGREPEVVHYANEIDVVGWGLEKVPTRDGDR